MEKIKRIIDVRNAADATGTPHSSIDPVRKFSKKYWASISKQQALAFVKKDFASENHEGDLANAEYAPFNMTFASEPTWNESVSFYETEQKVTFRADSSRFVGVEDPEAAWESFVTGELFPSSAGYYDSSVPPPVYRDHSFSLKTPLSVRELKDFNIEQRTEFADIQPVYNFYVESYEKSTKKQNIPEEVLPNLYVFKAEQVNEEQNNGAQTSRFREQTTLGGAVPSGRADILKARRGIPLDDATLERDANDKYLRNYGKYYKKAAKNNSKKLQDLKAQASRMAFTSQMLGEISSYNEFHWLFPMYSEIEFTTDHSTHIAQLLEDSELGSEMMKYVIAKEIDNDVPRADFVESYERFVAPKDQKYEIKPRKKAEVARRTKPVLDFLSWWSLYAEKKQTLDSKLSNSITMFGEDMSEPSAHARIRERYSQQVFNMIFQSKLRKFIKNSLRSYESMLKGTECYTEAVMYKVQKFKGRPTGKPIQTYYLCNSNSIDVLKMIDTQIKYGSVYTYTINAYHLVLGNQYYYRDIEYGSAQNTESSLFGGRILTDEEENEDLYYASATVVTRPSLKIIEVPIFAEKERIIDTPPIAPDVDIVPYRNIGNRILFNFKGSIGEAELHPIILNKEEKLHYDKVRKAQKRRPDEPLEFRSDDPASVFEVFRTTQRPKSYADFKDKKRVSVYTDVSPITPQKAAAASYVEYLSPNVKYYYMFRSIDVHGHISYPTAVFQVEMVDNNGNIFPLISTVEFEEEVPRACAKTAKKYLYLIPAIKQVVVNEEKSGLIDEEGTIAESAMQAEGNIFLGAQDDNIWDKKFKIRLTSRTTGKKIDLNIKFNYKHVQSENDYGDYEVDTTSVATTYSADLWRVEADEESGDEMLQLLEG